MMFINAEHQPSKKRSANYMVSGTIASPSFYLVGFDSTFYCSDAVPAPSRSDGLQ